MKSRQEKDAEGLLGPILDALQKNEPRLTNNEEIPQQVMHSIQNMRQEKSSDDVTGSSRIRYLTYAQRLLTAASVCLLILYGTEEFIIVRKMNTLEQRTTSVRIEPANSLAHRLAKTGIKITSLKQRFKVRKKLLAAQQFATRNKIEETLKQEKQEREKFSIIKELVKFIST